MSGNLAVHLGVMGAAAGAAEALKLLLEVCTVRSVDDPRAVAVTTNPVPGVDELGTATECIDMLFAAGCAAATIISRRPS